MKTQNSADLIRSAQLRAGLDRRTFLRGLGACIALPALESLRPAGLLASPAGAAGSLATTASGVPLRTAFLYFPNGAIPSRWWPEAPGPNPELSRTLAPLEPVRDSIQILGGLDHRNAEPGPDGAGDHARANGTFLTGVRVKKSATDIHAGISIDQIMARSVGHLTRFPSLELSCEIERKSGACDSGYACAYQFNLSWSSPNTPMAPEYNPRAAFERLFGAGPPGQRADNLRRRQQEDRSLLDFVLQEARTMQGRLDARDKEKLDQYLTSVREIETRIGKSEKLGVGKDPGVEAPADNPTDYTERMHLMFDLLVLAFQTDSTRVASLLLAQDGSNRPFLNIGIPEGHHELSHHFDNPDKVQKVADIDLWYVKQFAQFLQKLEQTKDVDGKSLLHNSMIVYGGGNADGNRHTHTNLPIILAGGGGGSLTPGRFKKFGSEPACNLFLAMADRMGVPKLDRFGDSTARVADI
jgi:hypothetical protein